MAFDSALQILSKDTVAQGVVALTLAHHQGRRLPDWAPGAHLDLVLPNGITRQYSLCGDRWDAHTYRVAILREADGRGGSAYAHDHLQVRSTSGWAGRATISRWSPRRPTCSSPVASGSRRCCRSRRPT